MVRKCAAGHPAQGAEAGGVRKAGEKANGVADAIEAVANEPELIGGVAAWRRGGVAAE